MNLGRFALTKKVISSIPYSGNCKRFINLLFLSILIGISPCKYLEAKEHSLEYKIKAAYLYNFSKFTDWPNQASFNETQSFYICILGKDPFGSTLTPIENKTIHGKQIKLVFLNRLDSSITDCRVLYIAEQNQYAVQSILQAISNTSILTVGDADNFATNGGIIGFVIEDGHVRLQINETVAYQAKLKFDPRLLRLGKSVKSTH